MRRVEIGSDLLASCDIFRGLSEADRNVLAVCLQGRRYAAGEVVFSEGDPASSLFVVGEGTFQATAAGPDGATRVLSHMNPGEVAGEMAFLDPGPRSATMTAVTEAVLFELSNDAMDALRARSPAALGAVVTAAIRDVTMRLRRLDERIASELERCERADTSGARPR